MKKSEGFTLIELMITIAIIGILAMIAVPNYQQFMREGRRADGQSTLLDIAARQEKYFMENHLYTANISDLGVGTSETLLTKGNYYSIAATCGLVPDGGCQQGYVLTATAQNGQQEDGNLKIDSIGRKTGKW